MMPTPNSCDTTCGKAFCIAAVKIIFRHANYVKEEMVEEMEKMRKQDRQQRRFKEKNKLTRDSGKDNRCEVERLSKVH